MRGLRLERGWSQEELAEKSGLSLRTVQRIEGSNRAAADSLAALAQAFGIDPAELELELRNDKRSQEWKKRPALVRMLFLGSGWVNIDRNQHRLAEKFLVAAGIFCGVAGLLGMFGLVVDHEHVVAFLGCSAGLLLCGWLTALSIRLGDDYAVWPWVEPK